MYVEIQSIMYLASDFVQGNHGVWRRKIELVKKNSGFGQENDFAT